MKKTINTTRTRYVKIDGWRGYLEPVNAVGGCNDTGTWIDSPCNSHVAKKEVDAFTKLLRKNGIKYRTTWGSSSNVFMNKRFVCVHEDDREKAYDLILCGVMSEDAMQGLVGPVLSGLLDWPCLTAVQTMTWTSGSREVICEREIEGGRQEVVSVELPALLTIQSSALRPRYPALSKLLRANQYPLEMINENSALSINERQRIDALKPPMRTRKGIRLEGSPEDKAQQLATLLRAKGFC